MTGLELPHPRLEHLDLGHELRIGGLDQQVAGSYPRSGAAAIRDTKPSAPARAKPSLGQPDDALRTVRSGTGHREDQQQDRDRDRRRSRRRATTDAARGAVDEDNSTILAAGATNQAKAVKAAKITPSSRRLLAEEHQDRDDDEYTVQERATRRARTSSLAGAGDRRLASRRLNRYCSQR